MTTSVPTLKRETTRTLCDKFTTIFDHNESITVSTSFQDKSGLSTQPPASWTHPAPSLSSEPKAPLESNNLTGLWNLDNEQESIISSSSPFPGTLPSPAISVFTPAGTPCSESDESSMLDSLSPPSSPWFPSSFDLEKGLAENQQSALLKKNSKFALLINDKNNTNDTINNCDISDLDFFNNSFYQSLSEASFRRQRSHPYFPYQRPSSASVVAAVRSAKANHASSENSRTAAPSDLFNVTIDEILSTDPLNLGDLDLMDPVSVTTGSSLETPAESDEDEYMQVALTVAEQVSRSQANVNSDDTEVEKSEQQSVHPSSQETILSMSEGDASDIETDTTYTPSKRTRAAKKMRDSSAESSTPQPRRRSGPKAPRVRKQVKKAPKVYPPRKPKQTQAAQEDENESTISISAIPKSSPISSKNSSGRSISTTAAAILEDGFFRCNMCPHERFGRVHDLKRHQISKHNEKTWPCDFCHRPFVRRDALLRHYAVKAERRDGIHPNVQESNRLSEARARARLS
ncbi:hypothetical protein BGZ46_008090 [Entomortierella lignicola]|nr:hypothetical protein BGZ46_008090 [Entomortierella lignicola]